MAKSDVLIATEYSTVRDYINKRRNKLSEHMGSPVENHDLESSLQNNTMRQAYSRVPKCYGRLNFQVDSDPVNRMVSAPSGVQRICQRWFTHHIDLFATRLSHKNPLYVSPVPDPTCMGDRCSKHKLVGSTGICLSMALHHRVIKKNLAMQFPHHPNSSRLARMPWFSDLVFWIPFQLLVSTTLLK